MNLKVSLFVYQKWLLFSFIWYCSGDAAEFEQVCLRYMYMYIYVCKICIHDTLPHLPTHFRSAILSLYSTSFLAPLPPNPSSTPHPFLFSLYPTLCHPFSHRPFRLSQPLPSPLVFSHPTAPLLPNPCPPNPCPCVVARGLNSKPQRNVCCACNPKPSNTQCFHSRLDQTPWAN